jgi:hypothetical protein
MLRTQLPAKDQAMSPTSSIGVVAHIPPPLRVLIVEDDAETALAYEILLQMQGL